MHLHVICNAKITKTCTDNFNTLKMLQKIILKLLGTLKNLLLDFNALKFFVGVFFLFCRIRIYQIELLFFTILGYFVNFLNEVSVSS